jgi:hypothetical protein
MQMRTIVFLALVPALAVAAPKPKPKKPPVKPTKTTKPDAASEPVAPPDAPVDPKPDAKPDAKSDPKTPPGTTPATPGGGGTGAGAGSGAGGGSGEPKKADGDEPKEKPSGNEPDVDSLRQEYLSLRDELFKSRARANAVASQLYSTRIQVKLTYTTARYYNPAKATIRLDGASVYENTTGAIGTDDGVRHDGYLAPGRHLLTFRIEATGKDDDTFGSVTETQIVVKAVAGKDLIVTAKAHDGGDIAYEWKRKERGSYGLGIDVAVKTTARPKDEAGAASEPAAKPAAKPSKDKK